MKSIRITLPDKSTSTYPEGISTLEIAQSVSPGLAREALAVSVNGDLVDLATTLNADAEITFYKGDSPEGHEVLLHSAAHLMAHAVKELHPEAKVTIGPAIENRFYYDFDIDGTFSEEDLGRIEDRMHALSKKDYSIHRQELSRAAALKLFREREEPYKVEIIEQIEPGDTVSVYTQGDFTDLCRGPHVPSTGRIKHFKLLSSSGAYWRGDEANVMLQRIYGTVFSTRQALQDYLHFLEEARKRDHRRLGKELELFTFDDEVGPGLPLWLPNGTVIIDALEDLARETESRAGYLRVRSPHLTKGSLYEKSGHLAHFKDSMYPAMDVDGTPYYVKPMNCPHHHKIYAATPKSYRDLPYRLAEYGTCYRYEKSGQLFGLMRVRSMQMNDAHIYCTRDQFQDEFLAVCRLYLEYFRIFGIEKYAMELSLHNPDHLGQKYINEPELWQETERAVRAALDEGGIPYEEKGGEAAFYGPKIDVQIWSAIGREFTLATNQVDFAIPARFGLTYTTANGSEEAPLCIHRAPLGTHERFIGFLIEHYGGDFPLWLAPRQVVVLPISEKVLEYAQTVHRSLVEAGIRASLDDRPDKINTKIRQSELSKINIMAVVGPREREEGSVSVRRRHGGQQGHLPLERFIASLQEEIKTRRNPDH